MKVNELRTGNLVLLKCKNEKDEIAKLLSIDEIDGCYYNNASNKKYINKKYTQRRNGWCKFDIINAIPLTEEWLLKFGFVEFKYNDGVYGFCKQGFGYINSGQIRWSCEGILFNDDNHLSYVHQLQNLYFALIGEELKTS